MRRNKAQGFTLIELIIVIVIVSILGVGLVTFITNSVQGVSNTADRQQRATIAWIVSEKLSTQIRNALPNSFRLNGDGSCIEFVPTVAGSDYLDVPISVAASDIDVVNFPNYGPADVGGADRIAVYPTNVNQVYSLGTQSVISNTTVDSVSAINAGPETGTQTISLNAVHRFVSDSPSKRLFVVSNPVMYCFANDGFLNLYGNYGFNTSMPDPLGAGSPAGAPITVANRIDMDPANRARFNYEPGTLSRGGVVIFAYQISRQNEGSTDPNQVLSQEVQIRNVP